MSFLAVRIYTQDGEVEDLYELTVDGLQQAIFKCDQLKGELQEHLDSRQRELELMRCRECGHPMFIDYNSGTAHHIDNDSLTGVNHDLDEDHVALSDKEEP
jgi:hypothetical protein